MSEQEINMEPNTEEMNQGGEQLISDPEPVQPEVDPKKELAKQIKACAIGDGECKGLSAKIRSTAEELGVTSDELLDGVFAELAKKEPTEDQIQS